MDTRWGLDLGGTKIEGVVITKEDNEVLARLRVPTEGDKGYEHVIGQIGRLLDMLEAEVNHRPTRVGIGTPGAIDPPTGLLKNSNSQSINKKPFLTDLQASLPDMKVVMANDANCFALAEAMMGAVQDVKPEAQVVFGIIMGTGVGGGLVINGQVLNGAHGIGGEWGHNFLDESGYECYCGKHGCVETILAGPSLERYYWEASGESRKLKEIWQRYEAGNDAYAQETIDRLVHFFGLGFSSVINIVDPDVVVIGGGVSNLPILYTEGVKSLEKHVFNPRFDTPVVPPKLGDSAGVFGAAFLYPTALA
ncbi:MAG TPA: sugar kinase [Cytophagales bacterium]|nr:sugar kinase [Cytophagales bacterium]